jgi:hypothetical protein
MAMKNFIIALVFSLLALNSATSIACTVGNNDTYHKNILAAYAASHFDLVLSDINVTLHSFETLLEGDDENSCPAYLNAWARVSLSWSPKSGESCSASVTVELQQGLIEGLNFAPSEEVHFVAPEMGCEKL